MPIATIAAMNTDRKQGNQVKGGVHPYASIDPDREETLPQPTDAGLIAGLTEQLPLTCHMPAPRQQRSADDHVPSAPPARSGNPYARIDPDNEEALESSAEHRKRTLSIRDFEARCRAIFKSYMPAWLRRGSLHPHYRDFIARNRVRPADVRYRIVKHLENYSLEDLPGLTTQFNREDKAVTSEKLAEIERRAETDP